jgi:hypothetical protein
MVLEGDNVVHELANGWIVQPIEDVAIEGASSLKSDPQEADQRLLMHLFTRRRGQTGA